MRFLKVYCAKCQSIHTLLRFTLISVHKPALYFPLYAHFILCHNYLNILLYTVFYCFLLFLYLPLHCDCIHTWMYLLLWWANFPSGIDNSYLLAYNLFVLVCLIVCLFKELRNSLGIILNTFSITNFTANILLAVIFTIGHREWKNVNMMIVIVSHLVYIKFSFS